MNQRQVADDTQAETQEHFLELLKRFDTALLITHTPSGLLHGRPMGISQIEDDGSLWFFSSIDSPKAAELTADPRAMISLQKEQVYLAINGEVAIVRDREKIRELWKESYRVWFKSENDPNLVLLHFRPTDAEYWNNAGVQGLRYALRAAKAYVTGNPIKAVADPDTHGKVSV